MFSLESVLLPFHLLDFLILGIFVQNAGNLTFAINHNRVAVLIGIRDLCQYFEHKKLKGYADFFNSSSSFCCGVI